MQGDIFQMEQTMGSKVQVQLPPPSAAPKLRTKLYSTAEPQAHIYNEDDLSHLLYVDEHNHPRHHHHHHHHHNHQHHFHNNEKILINNVAPHDDDDDDDDDAGLTPPEFLSPLTGTTGTHTPASGSETPVLSDCDSDVDTGAEADNELECPPSPSLPVSLSQPHPHHHHGRKALAREDGFEFPVFLGRQSEDDDADDEEQQPPVVLASWPQQQQRTTWPATKARKPVGPLHVEIRDDEAEAEPELPGEQHVSAIDGPMMSWWPAPAETLEHEWVTDAQEKRMRKAAAGEGQEREQETVEKKAVLPATDERHHDAVSDISGPLMTWWPAPLHLLEHEWIEAFYE